MQRSTERRPTTHTGSLPRPPALTAALARRDRGEPGNGALTAQIREAMLDVVRRQVEAGVTVVNAGEVRKIGYSTYAKERLIGFGGESGPDAPHPDAEEFPVFVQGLAGRRRTARPAEAGGSGAGRARPWFGLEPFKPELGQAELSWPPDCRFGVVPID